MDQVERLFGDYVHYRRHTAHLKKLEATIPYMRDPKLNDERRAFLESMIEWCDEHKLNTRWWLYSLFYARRWIASPRWDQLTPGTKKTETKALKRYAALTNAPLYSDLVTQELRAKQETAGDIYDPNRDLNTTVENVKSRYLDAYDTDRCLREMREGTLGYHPKSLVCARCPARQECESRLQESVPFDIVALRRGDITSDMAKRMSGRFHAVR